MIMIEQTTLKRLGLFLLLGHMCTGIFIASLISLPLFVNYFKQSFVSVLALGATIFGSVAVGHFIMPKIMERYNKLKFGAISITVGVGCALLTAHFDPITMVAGLFCSFLPLSYLGKLHFARQTPWVLDQPYGISCLSIWMVTPAIIVLPIILSSDLMASRIVFGQFVLSAAMLFYLRDFGDELINNKGNVYDVDPELLNFSFSKFWHRNEEDDDAQGEGAAKNAAQDDAAAGDPQARRKIDWGDPDQPQRTSALDQLSADELAPEAAKAAQQPQKAQKAQQAPRMAPNAAQEQAQPNVVSAQNTQTPAKPNVASRNAPTAFENAMVDMDDFDDMDGMDAAADQPANAAQANNPANKDRAAQNNAGSNQPQGAPQINGASGTQGLNGLGANSALGNGDPNDPDNTFDYFDDNNGFNPNAAPDNGMGNYDQDIPAFDPADLLENSSAHPQDPQQDVPGVDSPYGSASNPNGQGDLDNSMANAQNPFDSGDPKSNHDHDDQDNPFNFEHEDQDLSEFNQDPEAFAPDAAAAPAGTVASGSAAADGAAGNTAPNNTASGTAAGSKELSPLAKALANREARKAAAKEQADAQAKKSKAESPLAKAYAARAARAARNKAPAYQGPDLSNPENNPAQANYNPETDQGKASFTIPNKDDLKVQGLMPVNETTVDGQSLDQAPHPVDASGSNPDMQSLIDSAPATQDPLSYTSLADRDKSPAFDLPLQQSNSTPPMETLMELNDGQVPDWMNPTSSGAQAAALNQGSLLPGNVAQQPEFNPEFVQNNPNFNYTEFDPTDPNAPNKEFNPEMPGAMDPNDLTYTDLERNAAGAPSAGNEGAPVGEASQNHDAAQDPYSPQGRKASQPPRRTLSNPEHMSYTNLEIGDKDPKMAYTELEQSENQAPMAYTDLQKGDSLPMSYTQFAADDPFNPNGEALPDNFNPLDPKSVDLRDDNFDVERGSTAPRSGTAPLQRQGGGRFNNLYQGDLDPVSDDAMQAPNAQGWQPGDPNNPDLQYTDLQYGDGTGEGPQYTDLQRGDRSGQRQYTDLQHGDRQGSGRQAYDLGGAGGTGRNGKRSYTDLQYDNRNRNLNYTDLQKGGMGRNGQNGNQPMYGAGAPASNRSARFNNLYQGDLGEPQRNYTDLQYGSRGGLVGKKTYDTGIANPSAQRKNPKNYSNVSYGVNGSNFSYTNVERNAPAPKRSKGLLEDADQNYRSKKLAEIRADQLRAKGTQQHQEHSVAEKEYNFGPERLSTQPNHVVEIRSNGQVVARKSGNKTVMINKHAKPVEPPKRTAEDDLLEEQIMMKLRYLRQKRAAGRSSIFLN